MSVRVPRIEIGEIIGRRIGLSGRYLVEKVLDRRVDGKSTGAGIIEATGVQQSRDACGGNGSVVRKGPKPHGLLGKRCKGLNNKQSKHESVSSF